MLKKISIFILIVALIVMIMPVKSYATGVSLTEKQIDVNNFNPGPPDSSARLNEIKDMVVSIIYYAGVFIAVGALMIMGIKYMLGSLEEKAQYKETMMPFVIGAILLFGGINIIKWIYDAVNAVL